jgi:hypothetical protein
MMYSKTLKERLEELDKLRGTDCWDSHQNNLWHALYKLYLKEQSDRWQLATAKRNTKQEESK